MEEIKNDVLDKIMISSNQSMAEDLYIQLKELIINGELKPGQMLPSESAFCIHYKIGRSTVREALRALELMNLIKRTKKGTYVNDDAGRFSDLSFNDILQYYSTIEDILEVRMILETNTAYLAARRAKNENLSNMLYYLNKMRECKNDCEKLTHYDTLFHIEVAKASQNKLLLQTMESISKSLDAFISLAFKSKEELVHRAIDFHENLYKAISEQKPQEAKKIMRKHILDSISFNEKIAQKED